MQENKKNQIKHAVNNLVNCLDSFENELMSKKVTLVEARKIFQLLKEDTTKIIAEIRNGIDN